MNQFFKSAGLMLLAGFILVGCGSFGGGMFGGSSDGGLFSQFQSPGTEQSSNEFSARMTRVDQANDRQAARNNLIEELMRESDQRCRENLVEIREQIEDWDFDAPPLDQFSATLERGMAQRNYDTINSDLKPIAASAQIKPGAELGQTITSKIEARRKQLGNAIRERKDMDIHRYPVKQALGDIKAYHQSCSLNLGIGEMVRASNPVYTDEQRKAKIESLMKLRQTLIDQGISPRAVQQKIDAVILAD